MQQETVKRAASTSPTRDTQRDAKRQRDACDDDVLRLAKDLWSDAEHRESDEIVRQRLLDDGGDILINNVFTMAVVLQCVLEVALEGPHSHVFLARPEPRFQFYKETLKAHAELLKLVGESYTSGSYKHIRCLQIFRAPNASALLPKLTPTYNQEQAVEQSWKREFTGTAVDALWSHIVEHYNRSEQNTYAHYTAIVQSSGMGKSRTVDELGKRHFVIPINLRGPNSTGFPPADTEVRDFLTGEGTQTTVYHRMCAFLEALFDQVTQTVRTEFGEYDKAEFASLFREKMTTGQTFQKHNSFRMAFFHKVVQQATQNLVAYEKDSNGPSIHSTPSKGGSYDFRPARACTELVRVLGGEDDAEPGSPSIPQREMDDTKASNHATKDPLIILAFDEAHTLTNPKDCHSNSMWWSNFGELRYVLRALHRFPCFSLFMSTTGKISQFTSAKEDDFSLRILSGQLVLIQPFTDLGFDTLAKRIALTDGKDLEDLTSNGHMVYLGRPLWAGLYDAGDKAVREDIITFAAAKLINADPRNVNELTDDQKLACLSQRLPLNFNSTTYIAQANERKQVEGHMRVCLKIDASFESMVTVSASEPLLSEAAYSIMSRSTFNTPKAMKAVLDGFSIDKGDRGEILVMLLLTIARDKAVGPPTERGEPTRSRIIDLAPFLVRQVFQNPLKLQQLYEDFPNSKIHFNHYVKVHQYAAIDAQRVLLLSSRGAGVLCANNQYAIDGINPFLYKGTKLTRENFGLILWQGKNDSKFNHESKPALFEAMNVYQLKILRADDPAVPLIKIVFALAAKTPALEVVRHPPSTAYNAVVYDIWCAGLSPEILSAVEHSQDHSWAALLQASYGWKSIYEGRNVDKDLRRSMNPGAACDSGHFDRWAKVV